MSAGGLVKPSQEWCDEHAERAHEAGVSPARAGLGALMAAMRTDEFYATAYRTHNLEGLPDGVPDEVDPNRRPGPDAIRHAVQKHGPLCCYLDSLDEFELLLDEG